MTITVEWYTPGVILVSHIGRWTWSQYFAAIQQVETLDRNASEPLIYISDFSQSGHLPPGAIVNGRRIMQATPPETNIVRAVVVAPSRQVRAALHILKPFNPTPLNVLPSMDDLPACLDQFPLAAAS